MAKIILDYQLLILSNRPTSTLYLSRPSLLMRYTQGERFTFAESSSHLGAVEEGELMSYLRQDIAKSRVQIAAEVSLKRKCVSNGRKFGTLNQSKL